MAEHDADQPDVLELDGILRTTGDDDDDDGAETDSSSGRAADAEADLAEISEPVVARYAVFVELLTAEEEISLGRIVREAADSPAGRKAIERMMAANEGLVRKNAGSYMAMLRSNSDRDDLLQEARMGLMRGILQYNPDWGFNKAAKLTGEELEEHKAKYARADGSFLSIRLSTYVTWFINQAIVQFLYNNRSIVSIAKSNGVRNAVFRLPRAMEKLKISFWGASLTVDEIKALSVEMRADVKDVESAFRYYFSDQSLNAPLSFGDESSPSMIDLLPADADGDTQEELAEKVDQRAMVENILSVARGALNDRDYRIFLARFTLDEPTSLAEIAQRERISKERVRQIEARVLDRVKGLMARFVIIERASQRSSKPKYTTIQPVAKRKVPDVAC